MTRLFRDLIVSRWRELQFLASFRRGISIAPPPSLKLPLLHSLLKNYPMDTSLVAFGTFSADAVAVVRRLGHPVISLERDGRVYAKVQRQFRNDRDVVLIYGDSIDQLSHVVSWLARPAILWLDHSVLPSLAELRGQTIRSHSLLINNAGSFDGRDSRPDLLAVLTAIRSINSSYRIKLESDLIVAVVERTASTHRGWRVHVSSRIASPKSTNHQQPSPSLTNG